MELSKASKPVRNPIMIGQRLYLRPEEPGDAESEARASAEETDDFIVGGGRLLLSPIMLDEVIRQITESQPPDEIALAACLTENDEFIGVLGLESIDYVNRTARSYAFFNPGEYRGHGYGTEAKMLLLEYAFDHLQLHLICSVVASSNQRSAAALLKQGYRPAGKLKWHYSRRGVYTDTLLFDVKRDEWQAAKQARHQQHHGHQPPGGHTPNA